MEVSFTRGTAVLLSAVKELGLDLSSRAP